VDFKDAVKAIKEHKLFCNICRGPMKLIHAIFKQREREYGDPKYGMWICPTHSGHKFYPLVLRRAYEDSDYTNDLYEKIAKLGYPPRCPFCKTKMQYADERMLACAY
jgi:uncharacterized protein YbaR (Trm112 family)